MEAIQTEFETSKPKTASLKSPRFLSLLRLNDKISGIAVLRGHRQLQNSRAS